MAEREKNAKRETGDAQGFTGADRGETESGYSYATGWDVGDADK